MRQPYLDFVEPDPKRLCKRLMRVTALEQPAADALIEGDVEKLMTLSPEQQAGVLSLAKTASRDSLEAIIGTRDFLQIYVLDVLRASSRATARILNQGRAWATGFRVSENLFLTNHHVFENDNLNGYVLEFNYEHDPFENLTSTTRYAINSGKFFLSSQALDYTLVAVGEKILGQQDLNDFGFQPLSGASDKHAEGDWVNIIQHPAGEQKQIVMRENRVMGRGKKGFGLYYGADTQPGSSGSMVLNDQGELIALHRAGGPEIEAQLEDGSPVPNVNEGVRISAIVSDLTKRMDELSVEKQLLLQEALSSGFRRSSLIDTPKEKLNIAPMIETQMDKTIQIPTIKINIPLELNFSVPNPINLQADLEEDAPNSSRFRNGFRPRFLGKSVALPELNQALIDKAAMSNMASRVSEPWVLDYTHFSIVMHKERKIALYTAVNIDGKNLVDVVRTKDNWIADPRISIDQQTNNDLYLKNKLDRGHLVRRRDPDWGNIAEAEEANRDTFYFTNCSPQHERFNQEGGFWNTVEDYVLSNAVGQRICLFNGPVLEQDDPLYRGVQIPKTFWKLLVRIAPDGSLRSTAFRMSQEALLKKPLEAFEDDDLVKVFQIKVTMLEGLTGLDFGKLRESDAMGVQESAERRIESFSEIKI